MSKVIKVLTRSVKQILILLPISFGLQSHSQSDNWHFGVQLYPNFTNGIPVRGSIGWEYYKGIGTTSFSYSAGGKVTYDLSERLALSTGVLYQNASDRSKIYEPDSSNWFFYHRYYKTNFVNLEIPLNAELTILDRWLVSVGVSGTYNLSNSISEYKKSANGQYVFSSEEEYDGNLISKYNFLINAGIGYKKSFNPFTVSFSAYCQYHLLTDVNRFGYNYYGSAERKYLSMGLVCVFFFDEIASNP